MNQKERAELLQKLHVKGSPIIFFNIWDAGGAKALEEAGAKAIATGSWSVAAANGFSDGQDLPLDLAIANAKRITAAVDLPVTIDFRRRVCGRYLRAQRKYCCHDRRQHRGN